MPRLLAGALSACVTKSDVRLHVAVRRRRVTRVAVVVIGSCLLAIVAGCEPAAPVPHDPSLAGVVATREFLAPQTVRLVLATGESIDLDFETTRNLNESLDEPDPDELFFYGSEPDGPWFATALPYLHGGFELWQSRPKAAVDGFILFESGLRLLIAKNYSESLTGPMEAGAPVSYLLNEQGEVTRRQ